MKYSNRQPSLVIFYLFLLVSLCGFVLLHLIFGNLNTTKCTFALFPCWLLCNSCYTPCSSQLCVCGSPAFDQHKCRMTSTHTQILPFPFIPASRAHLLLHVLANSLFFKLECPRFSHQNNPIFNQLPLPKSG